MRAIFLDRDGVINYNRTDYVKSWTEFEFLPGSLQALRYLHEAGYQVFVVTNQAAVGRKLITQATLDDIHARMRSQVLLHGGKIHDLAYCPHEPAESCYCRKPSPGMIIQLARQWRVDLSQAYLIGDACSDVSAAHRAGCPAILVRTGRGAEQLQTTEFEIDPPDLVAENLYAAVSWVLQRDDVTGQPSRRAPTRDLVHRITASGM